MRRLAWISVLGLFLSAAMVFSCGSNGDGAFANDAPADAKVYAWRAACWFPGCSSAPGDAGLPACTAEQVSGHACSAPGRSCDPRLPATAGCAQYYEQCADGVADMICP
jgi:hypothetical protein